MAIPSIDELNVALLSADRLVREIIQQHGLNGEEFEHDLFYGNPTLALQDVFSKLEVEKKKLRSDQLDEAAEFVRLIDGETEAKDMKQKFASLIG